jgi:hypothetical protein
MVILGENVTTFFLLVFLVLNELEQLSEVLFISVFSLILFEFKVKDLFFSFILSGEKNERLISIEYY